jgi:hypothetical protein
MAQQNGTYWPVFLAQTRFFHIKELLELLFYEHSVKLNSSFSFLTLSRYIHLFILGMI